MQQLYTQIILSKAPFLFSHKEICLLLGSCFVESIGKKMEENKFPTDLNPFGTLYNPASIAQAIRILLRPERFTAKDLFFSNDVYQSFSHHSRFSSPSQDECLKNINDRLFSSASSIRNCKRMSIRDEDEVMEYSTDPELIHEKYENEVDIVIDGGFGGLEASTIVDCTEEPFEIVRQGKGELN